jgi:diguanylate cyclase (GGDEF)-like protein/PAS domain S-box-containing protein
LQSLNRHILEQIVAASAEGIVLLDGRDPRLRIVYSNPTFQAQSGYSAVELEGMPWGSLHAGDDTNPDAVRVRAAIGAVEPCQATIPCFRKDGTTWIADITVRPLSNSRGETEHFLVQHASAAAVRVEREPNVQVDLLQRALGQAKQKIVSLSQTDAVTGLLRYEHFLAFLKRELAIARRDNRPLAVGLFEIVEFEAYRQTFGANAAESCLRMIAAQIAGVFRRACDLCGRQAETTFIVAVRGQDANEVRTLSDRVGEKVRSLGLHNPRAQSGRYLALRSLIIDTSASDEAEALVARIKAEFATTRGVAAAQRA